MSAPVGLGVPIPKMLPITGTWALPFALYQALLSFRVSAARIDSDTMIGDRSAKTPEGTTSNATTNQASPIDPLVVAVRSHSNFVENVPFALVFAAIAELNGANKKVLNYGLATLLALRIMHVELGLRAKNDGAALGRLIGHFGTQGFLLGVGGYAAYLIKGYWGF